MLVVQSAGAFNLLTLAVVLLLAVIFIFGLIFYVKRMRKHTPSKKPDLGGFDR